MKRTILYVLSVIIIVFAVSVYLDAQMKDPQIPRSWWQSAKKYIKSQAGAKMLSFTCYGTPTDQILSVFTPHDSLMIQRIDVFARAKVDSDSTALIITNGLTSARVVLDSGNAKRYWYDSTEVTFRALKPCTVKFSDNSYSGVFVTGADTPTVVIQYRVSD